MASVLGIGRPGVALMNRTQGDPVISLQDVEKRFGRKKVIDELCLDVYPGQFISLFGPNGAGKTTLLRIMSGQLGVDNGWIDSRSGTLKRSLTGFISHQVMLYPDLTGFENLEFYARLHSVPNPADAANRMIKRINLDSDASRYVRNYSRGMLQRLSLGRALINDPEILFLDEPFTGLDRQGAEFLAEILNQGHSGGKTILMATHDLRSGYDLSDRILVMTRGRISMDFSTRDLEFSGFVSSFEEVSGR